MKRNVLLGVCAVLVFSCGRQEMRAAQEMTINDVPISTIPNGTYTGSFTSGNATYAVRVTVFDGRLEAVKVLQNRNTADAKKAENIIGRVIEQQKLTVDPEPGAAAASKALLKAIEKALTKGATPAAKTAESDHGSAVVPAANIPESGLGGDAMPPAKTPESGLGSDTLPH
jgi:uncharacterized protein with FMN-binding domain